MVSEEEIEITEKNDSQMSESVTTVTEFEFEDQAENTTAILGKVNAIMGFINKAKN